MRTYRVNAIVLRRMDLGETDRIVTLYSRERGKIRGVAKGSRKPVSKLAGATELFTLARYLIASGQNLEVVTQTEIRESFPAIRRDLTRIAYATYMVELVDRFVEDWEANQELFDLLLSSLYMLESEVEPAKVARAFELQSMVNFGYTPELYNCSRCNEQPDEEELSYSPSVGGLVCTDCGPLPDDAIDISPETLKWMRTLMIADAPAIRKAKIRPDVMSEMARIMRWHIRYRLERDLKSTDFIDILAQVAPNEKL